MRRLSGRRPIKTNKGVALLVWHFWGNRARDGTVATTVHYSSPKPRSTRWILVINCYMFPATQLGPPGASSPNPSDYELRRRYMVHGVSLKIHACLRYQTTSISNLRLRTTESGTWYISLIHQANATHAPPKLIMPPHSNTVPRPLSPTNPAPKWMSGGDKKHYLQQES